MYICSLCCVKYTLFYYMVPRLTASVGSTPTVMRKWLGPIVLPLSSSMRRFSGGLTSTSSLSQKKLTYVAVQGTCGKRSEGKVSIHGKLEIIFYFLYRRPSTQYLVVDTVSCAVI